jgi:hypothetical protein
MREREAAVVIEGLRRAICLAGASAAIAVGCSSSSSGGNCCEFQSAMNTLCGCADPDAGVTIQLSGGGCGLTLTTPNSMTTISGGKPVGSCPADAGIGGGATD